MCLSLFLAVVILKMRLIGLDAACNLCFIMNVHTQYFARNTLVQLDSHLGGAAGPAAAVCVSAHDGGLRSAPVAWAGESVVFRARAVYHGAFATRAPVLIFNDLKFVCIENAVYLLS